MSNTVIKNPWVRTLVIVALVLVALTIFFRLTGPILVPLFLAFLVAYVFDPVVDFFEARKIPRGVTISVLAVTGILVLFCVPAILIPRMLAEGKSLVDSAYELKDRVDPSSILANYVDPETLDHYREMALEHVKRSAPELANAGSQVSAAIGLILSSFGKSVVGFFVFMGNLAIFAFVAGYMLKDYDKFMAGVKELIPIPYREKTFEMAVKIDDQIRGFLRGQMSVCACLGLMYGAGMLASGVPFAISLAIFGAIASFVPYLGITLTIVPAVALVLLRHGFDWHVGGVIATFVVAQMIEGTILTPKIVGDKVGLGPVWVILAVMVFGSSMGFLGLLLAVPIAAVLKVLVVDAVKRYKDSSVFSGSEAASGTGSSEDSG